MSLTWFGFECLCGVVTDVRLVGEPRDPPIVQCPICLKMLYFKARWLADDAGYGSRGDRSEHLAHAALLGGAAQVVISTYFGGAEPNEVERAMKGLQDALLAAASAQPEGKAT